MERVLDRLDKNRLLATSIGLVYLWFGILKFFPNLSPAEQLAKETINILTLGLISSHISILMLAVIEVGIGLMFILNLQIKRTIWVSLGHMVMTFTPLFFFPDLSFSETPYAFTLVGQYIFKNIIIISAMLAIYPSQKPHDVKENVTII